MSGDARRKKRRPRNKRGGSGSGSSSGSSQWQLQQTKVTIRNIEDPIKYGSVESILTMIGELVDKVNDVHRNATSNKQTATNLPPIKLDVKSVEKILKVEEMMKEKERETETKGAEETDSSENQKMEEEHVPAKTLASIVKGDEAAEQAQPVISARALYVVPAKMSRRRGEKSGCAYLVLTAPPPPPPVPRAVVTAKDAPVDQTAMESKPAVADDKMQVDGGETTTATTSTPSKDTVIAMKAPPGPVYTQAEKSRWTAVGKLQLLNAIEAMTAVADQDAKSNSQLYGKCQVAASISGKAWRDKEGGHRDRREGTIENTADFKQFFSKQNKAVEERQSRPKPAPGGGVTSENGGEAGSEQLSAIVMHLRAKRQESSQRKKAKKKANKDVKNKGKQQPESGGRGRNSSNTNSSNKGRGGRSRKEGGGSKNKNSSNSSSSEVVPSRVMRKATAG